MGSFLSFTASQFAIAGAICALGPILIHLLNRRRYKVVQWAAMDFLREALQRNRRMLQIRDIILLLLRTAAVLLFGLAIAQPFFSTTKNQLVENQAVHAVILIDNSLSMGYADPDRPNSDLLAKAKERARALIDRFPSGSKFSVIPVGGSRDGFTVDPYNTKASAVEALNRIEVVDRSATAQDAANQARSAMKVASELSKRIVFITDQQEINWNGTATSEALAKLPEMQIVDVSPPLRENTWISDLRLQDGLADVETPATIVVTIQSQGSTPRRDLTVQLLLGETVIGEKTISLEPSSDIQKREVDFSHTFSGLTETPEPGRPVFVALKATITPDNLPADDQRFYVAPIVAALPVVFVDQYGADENTAKSRQGETLPLRNLLAPTASKAEKTRQLIKIKHVKMGEVTQDLLADARLVVIAGVPSIDDSQVKDLRAYVQQGGQLLIAAGGNFDPEAWTSVAWKDGAGILPAPLKREPVGELPEVAGANAKPFFISYQSVADDSNFHLAGVAEEDLRDLYAAPYFFKAVATDLSSTTLETWRTAETKRLEEELTTLADLRQRQEAMAEKEAKGQLSEAERKTVSEELQKLHDLAPQWLTWGAGRSGIPRANTGGMVNSSSLPTEPAARQQFLDRLASKYQPHKLAEFDDAAKTPFLVERNIGEGRVVLVTTGLLSSWNTLPTTNTMLLFDRLLRSMTQATFPPLNFTAQDKLELPLPSEDHNLTVTLTRPNSAELPQSLDVSFLSKEQRGVVVPGMYERGVYRVAGFRNEAIPADAKQPTNNKPLWEIPLVVNGDSSESELNSVSPDNRDKITASKNLRLISVGDEISLAGATIRGQGLWWYFVLVVFMALIGEMAILAWPMLRTQPAA